MMFVDHVSSLTLHRFKVKYDLESCYDVNILVNRKTNQIRENVLFNGCELNIDDENESYIREEVLNFVYRNWEF